MALKATSIIIEYSELLANKNLHSLIEQAYGPKGTSPNMQVTVFFSSMEYLDTLNKGRKHSLFSTS